MEKTLTQERYRATPYLGAILMVQGRNQRWLARRVGISDGHLSGIILGFRLALPETVARIADTLQLPSEVLFAPLNGGHDAEDRTVPTSLPTG